MPAAGLSRLWNSDCVEFIANCKWADCPFDDLLCRTAIVQMIVLLKEIPIC